MQMPMPSFDPERLLRSNVYSLEPYAPIVPFEVLSERLGRHIDDIVKLDANENPYGPSQVARKAMRKAFSESNLYSMRYAKAEFKTLMAKLNGVTPEHIAVGFGSGEILKKAALMNGIDKGELLSPSLTFETINRYAKTMQSNAVSYTHLTLPTSDLV